MGREAIRTEAARKRETDVHVLWMRRAPQSHGDKRNIVYADLKKAADASKISVKEAVQNIGKTLRTRNLGRPLADDAGELLPGVNGLFFALLASSSEWRSVAFGGGGIQTVGPGVPPRRIGRDPARNSGSYRASADVPYWPSRGRWWNDKYLNGSLWVGTASA